MTTGGFILSLDPTAVVAVGAGGSSAEGSSAEGGGERLTVVASNRRMASAPATPPFTALIARLRNGGGTADALCAGAGADETIRNWWLLERLIGRGLLRFDFVSGATAGGPPAGDARRLLRLVPHAPGAPDPTRPPPGGPLRPARGVFFRRDDGGAWSGAGGGEDGWAGGGWTVERAAGLGRLFVADDPRLFGWLNALTRPAVAADQVAAELAAELAAGPTPDPAGAATVRALSAMLFAVGALEPASGAPASAQTAAHENWEFHDLLFHGASRFGRAPGPVGAVSAAAQAAGPCPEPPVRPRRFDAAPGCSAPGCFAPINLPPFDPAALSLSLAEATARRASRREPGGAPLNPATLGALLGGAVADRRFADRRPADPAEADPAYQAVRRPYPSGGSLHPLEVYLVVARAVGLDAGVYHYQSDAHRLAPVAPSSPAVRGMLATAQAAAGGGAAPDALIVVAARFRRNAWKYRGLSYALTLKETGALMQQLYLVAAALNLHLTALGGGDGELFAAATGLDPLIEGAVGEMALYGAGDPERRADQDAAP